MPVNALDIWFAAEILPHEAALMRYLSRVWPHRADHNDIRQDTYIRVYEAAAAARPANPRAFLFATARNLLTDRVRHNRVIAIDSTQDFDTLHVLVDELSPEKRINALQELRRLAKAFDQLSDRCRDVVWLRRIEGLSQREAAVRLGMHEGAVESQLARGVRALARAVFGPSEESGTKDRSRGLANETERG